MIMTTEPMYVPMELTLNSSIVYILLRFSTFPHLDKKYKSFPARLDIRISPVRRIRRVHLDG